MDRRDVQFARKGFEREKRLQLGRKRDSAIRRPIVQRLDAEPIPRNEEALGAFVPDREREHAAQPMHHVHAIILVQMHEHFRVRPRPHLVPRRERGAKRVVVVDLSVEHHVHGGVLIGDRLGPPVHVDDAEAPHSQRHSWSNVVAFFIGAPMTNGTAHRRQLNLGAGR